MGRSQPSVTMQTKTKDSGELKSAVILKELMDVFDFTHIATNKI